MSRLLKPWGVAIALGLLAVLFVQVIPVREIGMTFVARAIEAQTGQRLTVAGRLDLTLRPVPVLVAEGISLTAGAAEAPWLQAARVEVVLSSQALWRGGIVPVRVRLDGARIHLVQGPSGRGNWDPTQSALAGSAATLPVVQLISTVAAATADPSAPTAPVPTAPPVASLALDSPAKPQPPWLEGFPRDGIDLVDATLTWEDPATRRRLVLRGLGAHLVAEGDVLRVDHLVADCYGGGLAGTLRVAAADVIPHLTLETVAVGVQLGPLLNDLVGAGGLIGRADLGVSLVTQGTFGPAMLAALDGDLSLHLRDGALLGIDPLGGIQAAVARLRGRAVTQPDAQSDPKVVLDELTASAKLNAGILHSDDLQASGPWLDATGSGDIDLKDGRLDWRLVPVLKDPPQGRGLKELEGLPIPVFLTGTLEAPQWRVDAVAALAEAARRGRAGEGDDLIDKLERRSGIKGLGGMLRGLLGR